MPRRGKRTKCSHFRISLLLSSARLLPQGIKQGLSIAGIGALSHLGHNVDMHCESILGGGQSFPRLSEILGADSPFADQPAGWIKPRHLLTHRKWSPASMAALHVAGDALEQTKWTHRDLSDTALIVGTSRGNASGWLGEWPGRRPFRLMAASNTIHSEPASAISIVHQILGPNHLVASGCAAGLDALILAKLIIDADLADRALVIAVDLPLVPLLLENYTQSGLLSSKPLLDPFSKEADGFIPSEGAAAVALERKATGKVRFTYGANNSDGKDPVGIPKDGGRSHILLQKAYEKTGSPTAICPHSTGTKIQARAEGTIFQDQKDLTFHLLKPYLGHTIGASGLIESAVLLRFMESGMLPPNPSYLTNPLGWSLPRKSKPVTGPIFKLAHGMGGHNALTVFEPSQ